MNVDDWVDKYLFALSSDQPYPKVTTKYPELSAKTAYSLQLEIVKAQVKAGDEIAGFKAALTGLQAQQAMAISQPIIGALMSSGSHPQRSTLKATRALLLETELGYVCQRDIDHHVTAQNVFAEFQQLQPIIEVAAPNLSGKPNGIDLIATNSASYAYIRGEGILLDKIDVDEILTSLRRENQNLFEGRSGDVMSSQSTALAWLVNNVLDLGYRISPGHLFITGAIGGVAPGKPGHYTAKFAGLSNIYFTVES